MPITPGSIVATNYFGRQLVVAKVVSVSPKMVRMRRVDSMTPWTFQRYPEEIVILNDEAATMAVLRAEK